MKAEKSLTDFAFDDDLDFFGVDADQDNQPEKTKTVKDSVDKEKEKETINQEEESGEFEDSNFFKDASEDESEDSSEEEEEEKTDEEEEDTEKKSKKKEKEITSKEDAEQDDDEEEFDEKNFYTTLSKEMKDRNVFSNIDPEGEIDEEKFFKLQEDEVEARVEEVFNGFVEDLDDDAKAFMKFKKDGGDTREFLETLGRSSFDVNNIDIEDEDQVDSFLDYYLVNFEKVDKEDIEDRKEWLKDSKKIDSYVKRYIKEVKTSQEEEIANKLSEQEKIRNNNRKAAEKYEKDLNSIMDKAGEIKGFSINKDERKVIRDYILKPSKKVGDNKYIPAMMHDLERIIRGETEEDKKDLIVLSKLLKSNFDFSSIKNKARTSEVKEKRSKLPSTFKKSNKKGSGNSLADFFAT